jgi:hypothetical protein
VGSADRGIAGKETEMTLDGYHGFLVFALILVVIPGPDFTVAASQ